MSVDSLRRRWPLHAVRAAASIARPAYDRRDCGIGIVHLGIGAFHRAHQAMYTDDALGAGRPALGHLRREPALARRARSAGAAGRPVHGGREEPGRRAAAHHRQRPRSAVPAATSASRSHARLAAAATRIVSLTDHRKRLLPRSGDRAAQPRPSGYRPRSRASRARPESAVGLLVAALDARRRAHGTPLTVLCCDNLPHNGALVRGLVLAFAEPRDPSLARWIDAARGFPSTMVDRIVPATTDADIAENDAALGVHDAAPVDARAVQAVGDRGPISPRADRRGSRSARSSSPTWRRSRR